MSNHHEPIRRRWNRRSSDGAAWGDEASFIDQRSPRHSSRSDSFLSSSSPREPIKITAEFRDRFAAAARASVVTLATFSILVFSGQKLFPVAWFANVFAQSVLKSTLGGTILSIYDILVPMIPVACVSWAVSAAFAESSTMVYQILLPFVVASAALMIFLCPWPFLTSKNMMVLIFYLVVSSPLSLRNVGVDDALPSSLNKIGPFFVPALVGTICIGMLLALLVHATMLKFDRSTTAYRQVNILMLQVSNETNQLLLSLTDYMQSIGKASDKAQQARTLIDFHTRRRKRLINQLDAYLPAMRVESKLGLLSSNKSIDVNVIEEFVLCAKKQQDHAELVQAATTQTLLGEDYTSKNQYVLEVKEKISENLGYVTSELALEYRRCETAFFFVKTSEDERERLRNDLQNSMKVYLQAMRQAITDVEALLLHNDDASRSTAGPMIRVRVTFLALFSFIHELNDVLSLTAKKQKTGQSSEMDASAKNQVVSSLRMKWLWKDIKKRRLAIKTAVGLSLASLWVSIPFLNSHLAHTYSVWVGITVASISLETTGAAYTKALDRLWGTMIAAACSIFVGKVFHVSAIAKLFALTSITFISTLLSNTNRPYASRYAATSVGSILYGSIYNEMEVDDYVPTRIMLIFVGVIIFLVLEMLIFPRSSRTIVQAQTVQLFEDLEQFFYQLSKSSSSITSVFGQERKARLGKLLSDPLWMLRSGQKEIDVEESLTTAVASLKKTLALAKAEIRPATMEPALGLNISIDAVGYDRLLSESENIIIQIDLLVVTLQSLRGYYLQMSKQNPLRDLQWPSLLSAAQLRIAQQLSIIADEFRSVLPHGLFRPDPCTSNINEIVRAVSQFRSFAQVRLSILSDVENRHALYLESLAHPGEKVQNTPGFRLTLALSVSALLGVAQSLQTCGRHLERIIQTTFPFKDVTDIQVSQQNITIKNGSNENNNY